MNLNKQTIGNQNLRALMFLFGFIFILHLMQYPVWLGIGSVLGIYGPSSWYQKWNSIFFATSILSLALFSISAQFFWESIRKRDEQVQEKDETEQ